MSQLSLFTPQKLDPIASARQIFEQAQALKAYANVLMYSGGKDSQATYEICQVLGIRIDAIVHVNTRTGIPETTEYVRQFVESTGLPYIEADSGDAYENYVRRKGFFGVGTGMNSAHSFAFHVCKRGAYTRELANFRERKRGRKILMINGARIAESANRDANMRGRAIKCDRYTKGKPSSPNWWVSPLLAWTDEDRTTFLKEQKSPINPVSQAICRSGECMCGTTQGDLARVEASAYSPRWGGWIDRLEQEVKLIHGWGWGEQMPKPVADKKCSGQMSIFEDASPMCAGCRKLEI